MLSQNRLDHLYHKVKNSRNNEIGNSYTIWHWNSNSPLVFSSVLCVCACVCARAWRRGKAVGGSNVEDTLNFKECFRRRRLIFGLMQYTCQRNLINTAVDDAQN
jgi:hypothetical protein